jgi:uncharacterized protein (DUF736 family)
MATIGNVTKMKDGKYVGHLKTLSISAAISIEPVGKKKVPSGPDYMVLSKGVEVGAAWNRKGQRSGKDYVSVQFTAPEFGNEPLYANLGREADSKPEEGKFALIWNPRTNSGSE